MPALLLVGSQMRMGGAQRVLLTIARWFHERGTKVTVAFFYDKDGLHQRWQEEAPFPIINLRGWSNDSSLRNYFRLFGGVRRLYLLIRSEKFSAALTFTHHANLLGIPTAWLGGVPVRVASHRGRIYGFPRWQEWLHSQMINLGMAKCLLALSEGVRQEAIREGVKPERVIVIHNGVEKPSLDQGMRSRIRMELDVPDGAALLLSTGRLAPEKGHSVLMQSIPAVLERNKQVVVVIAGEGPLRAGLEEMARKLGVGSQVRFLGLRQDVLELAFAADLFVMPSISEGLGQALLEAMSVGTPVLASNVGGIPELIVDGITGRLVRPSDPGALAEAISDLLGDENERRRLGMAGKQFIAEHFTLEQMCQKYAWLLLGEGAGAEDRRNP